MLDKNSLTENFDIIKQSKNNIILFGSVGTGKTTLINKLCGVDFETSSRGFSCTRDIQYSFTKRNDNIIIDFPGLNATVDIIKHLKVQKNTLSIIPVRLICFVVKYSTRYDDLIRAVSQMLTIFKDYRKNIVLIITNSEGVHIKDQSEIEHIFTQKFRMEYILFTIISTDSDFLSDKINNIKMRTNNIDNVTIETRNLLQTIDPEFDIDVFEDREKYLEEFQESLKLFEDEFKKTKEKDLKRALYFALKNYKENLIKKYSSIVREKKEDSDLVITELIMFNNAIFNDFDKFRQKVELELDTQTTNYNGEYNRYKQCTQCGLIWFRIVGCDSIVCGKRSTIKDKIFGRFKNFIVSFTNKKIKINTIEENNNQKEKENEFTGLTEKEINKNIILKSLGKKEIQPLGCGAHMSWKHMTDVTDKVNRELKQISVSDYDSAVRDIANEDSIHL